MVGNDIVDLRDRDADPATLHPRYDARVFTPAERRSIARASDPGRHRWRIWAAKEACFKLARQLQPDTIFSPRRFETLLSPQAGERILGAVAHASRRFRVEISEGRRFIHALALRAGPHDARFSDVVRWVERHGEGVRRESEAVRRLVCRELARRLEVPREALGIDKQDGIPFVSLAGERLPVSLSFSHHGELAAFAALERSPGEVRA